MTDREPCAQCDAEPGQRHRWVEGTCVLPHRMDKPHHPPRATHGHVCTHCVERWRQHLTEIVELYAHLADLLAGERTDDAEIGEHKRQKKSVWPPAPIRHLEAWAMLFHTGHLYAAGPRRDDGTFAPDYVHTAAPDVLAVLQGWCSYLYEAKHWDPGNVSPTVAGCADTLAAYAEDIAHEPWLDDFDAEITWLRTALRRVHGLSDPRPLGECMNTSHGEACTGAIWRQEVGDPKCDRCGRLYGRLDLMRLSVQRRWKERAS